MSGAPGSSWVYLPSLAAELPDGWVVSEGSTFTSPSGVAVHVRLDRAPDGWDAVALADHQENLARAELGEIDVVANDAVPAGVGPAGRSRRFRFDRDGVATVGRIVCSVDDGLALTVSATWPEADDDAGTELDRVVAGLRLLRRPVAAFGTVPDGETVRAPQARAAVEDSVWSAMRAAWDDRAVAGTSVPDAAWNGARWSPEECAVFATILGSPSFPTVGSEVLAALPERALHATLSAVTNSFVARGVVRALDDGSVGLVDEVDQVVQVAVFPDLTVSVDRITAGAVSSCWFGVRPDRAVLVRVEPTGSRACGGIDPGELVAHVLAVTGTAEREVPVPSASERIVTLDEVVTGAAGVDAIVRVTTAWRVGGVIHGGDLAWALGADGSLWLAEPVDADDDAPAAWQLRPVDTDAVRSELLDHLPGG